VVGERLRRGICHAKSLFLEQSWNNSMMLERRAHCEMIK
jgi:hypothetical protein